MRLILDSDVFCVLGSAGLLRDTVDLFGLKPSDCGRLPALPYMLRRGRLRRSLGAEACEELLALADEFPVIAVPGSVWLDRLALVEAIDPGEAQIFALAADHGLIVVSGDKRALRALRLIDGYPEALRQRVVILEAVLLALCARLGSDEVGRRCQPLMSLDQVVRICFSPSNAEPIEALWSYHRTLSAELQPLELWSPPWGATT